MDLSTIFDQWLTWFADQLALLSNLPAAYIGLAAVVPLLIALMLRDLLATLSTALFALGVISLCATQDVNWAHLAIFEATAGLLLASAAVVRRRQSRALRAELQSIRDELSGFNERLNALEVCERRRIMESLHSRNRMDTTGLLTPAAEARHSETKIRIAPT